MRVVNTKLRKGYGGRRDRENENGCAYAGLCPDPQVGDRDEHENRMADERYEGRHVFYYVIES